MQVQRKDLEKSQLELTIEIPLEEFKPYIEKGALELSKNIKIEGFRPGKAPYNIIKQKVGEMAILEEAANLAIHKTIWQAITDVKDYDPIGQPQVNVTKLAPENPMEYKVVLSLMPKITLGEYKDLGIKEDEVKVEEKEVEKAIAEIREMRAKEIITEEEAKSGDKVIVDLEMFLDKVPVDGGQAQGAAILLGKEYLVPGFDKNIIGQKKGAELNFSLPYPENHFQKNLAGKMVDFKVKVKEVYKRELPELNDDFSHAFGFKKYAEMEEYLRNNIKTTKAQQAEQRSEIKMLEAIVEKAKFGDLPELLLQNESDLMMKELENSIMSQGGNFEDYLNSVKKTRGEIILEMMPTAIKRVKSALAIREIAKQEKLSVSEEEVEKKIEEIKAEHKSDARTLEMVKEPHYKSYLFNLLSNQKVIKQLRDWNIKK